MLKLAQRKRAMRWASEITWTFDPLQSLNAHLNFAKLGVISRRYIVNFYGEASSSPLHQGFGTDRLWVNWLLESERVNKHISRIEEGLKTAPDRENLLAGDAPLLVSRDGDRARLSDLTDSLSNRDCLIEIPHDVTALKQHNPEAAVQWRETTRTAFLAAIEAGFTVADFLKRKEEDLPGGSTYYHAQANKGSIRLSVCSLNAALTATII